LASINFEPKGVDYQINNKIKLKNWLEFVGKIEKVKIERLDYFFVSENEIIDINKKFLKHNYKTDIITFNTGFLSIICGEIFICLDVVKENAFDYSKGYFDKELYRVIVHGLLHLIGYNDYTSEEIRMMREREEYHLNELFKTL
jgi:rRNA maturation RNase YbeY